MPVVSRDVIWLLSQIRVISSELAKPARATATPAVHVGALTPEPKGSWTTTDPAQRVEVTAYPNRGASVRVETGVRTMFTRRIAITSSAILAPGHSFAAAGFTAAVIVDSQ
jgi:hypothetical protein